MPMRTILVDIVAILLAVMGFHMAFRQRLVRGWWAILNHGDATRTRAGHSAPEEDPVHYALIIFGIMLMAFGVIIFSFTTAYTLLTR